VELAKVEEKLSKQKARQLFDTGDIAKQRQVYQIDDRAIYMKGIDASYYYEGYSKFKTEEL